MVSDDLTECRGNLKPLVMFYSNTGLGYGHQTHAWLLLFLYKMKAHLSLQHCPPLLMDGAQASRHLDGRENYAGQKKE